MKPKFARRWLQNDELNFLLTNRIPRIFLTRCVGRLSALRSPLATRAMLAVWRLFTDLDLSEAKKSRFDSLHDCFTRELKEGARPIDGGERVLTSPCDAIVGAAGAVHGTTVYQAKGSPYSIADLFGSTPSARRFAARFADGTYITLRLTSAMYHRFHAPHDCTIEHVTYLSGDVWNVNPPALARIARLYCRNERAVLRARLAIGSYDIAMVPVAAVLVASIRLHFLDVLLHLRYDGPNEMPCHGRFVKGAELGWFEHGSTIIVFAPPGFALRDGLRAGDTIRMGEALMSLPEHD